MIRLLFLITLIFASSPAFAQVGDPSAPNAITDPLAAAMANSATPVDGPPTQQGEGWAVALWHYAQNIYTTATSKADAGIGAMEAANIEYVVPFLKGALVLLVMTEIIAQILGNQAHNPLGHVVRRVLRWAVIMVLIGNAGAYQQHVATPLMGMVNDLSGRLTGAMGGGAFTGAAAFDNEISSSWQAVWTIVKTTPFIGSVVRAIFIYFLSAITFLIIGLAIAAAFVAWLVGLLTLKIGLAVGPLFIAGSLVPKTTALTDNWIAVVGSAAATQILAVLVISLLGFADQATTGAYLQGATGAGNNPVTGVQALVAMGITSFVLGVFVFWEAPRMAAGLFRGLVAAAAPYTAAAAGAFAGAGAIASFGAGAAAGALGGGGATAAASTAAPLTYAQGGAPLSRAFQTANQQAGRVAGGIYVP